MLTIKAPNSRILPVLTTWVAETLCGPSSPAPASRRTPSQAPALGTDTPTRPRAGGRVIRSSPLCRVQEVPSAVPVVSPAGRLLPRPPPGPGGRVLAARMGGPARCHRCRPASGGEGRGSRRPPAPVPALSNEESHRRARGARGPARGGRVGQPPGVAALLALLPLVPTPDKSTFYFPEEDPRTAAEEGPGQPLSFRPPSCRAGGAGGRGGSPGAPEGGPRLCPETDSGSGSTGGAAPGPERLSTPGRGEHLALYKGSFTYKYRFLQN